MTHDKIATFYLVLFFKGLRASWQHRHWYTSHARHRASYIGSRDARPAMDLVFDLRSQRDLHGHQL